jgi:hypothetical protein
VVDGSPTGTIGSENVIRTSAALERWPRFPWGDALRILNPPA